MHSLERNFVGEGGQGGRESSHQGPFPQGLRAAQAKARSQKVHGAAGPLTPHHHDYICGEQSQAPNPGPAISTGIPTATCREGNSYFKHSKGQNFTDKPFACYNNISTHFVKDPLELKESYTVS